MENRKKDHTYTQNSSQQQQEVTKKDRKKDHTYSKENQFIIISPDEVVQQTVGAARDDPTAIDDTDVNQFKAKPDHSYSMMDKPKFAHREKHENKVPLPYPLKGDHEYVRGTPNTMEIIVSKEEIFFLAFFFHKRFQYIIYIFFGGGGQSETFCQVQRIEIRYSFNSVATHGTPEAFSLRSLL